MAVSRRLRFEILRRDGHTCRYCGAKAPDVALTVDHVIPVALGGGDEPSNLIAACRDCNAGKTSIAPDSPIVEDVDATALLFARAMEQATEARRKQLGGLVDFQHTFLERWDSLLDRAPMPRDWPLSVERFLASGLTGDDLLHFMDVTYDRNKPAVHCWKYFCGCCWNEIGQRQEIARRLVEDGEA